MELDPYSLDRLQDIVQPEPVSWWPPAPFWWFVAAMVTCWAVYLIVMAAYRFVQNAYRRQALRELRSIEQQMASNQPSTRVLITLSALLKRVALVSFPRERVAALSGEDWLRFLNETCEQVDFLHGPVRHLATASYEPMVARKDMDWGSVLPTVRKWIVGHRAERPA